MCIRDSFKIDRGQVVFKRWRIVRGDKVFVRNGKDKGKTGKVIRVYRKKNQLLVQGVNVKLQRVKGQAEKDTLGGVRQKVHPIHVSKCMLIDPSTGKPTKIRFGFLTDGQKVRISKTTNTIIPKPVFPGSSPKVRNKNKIDGPKDTPPEKVIEVTYQGEDFAKIKREFEEFIREKERRERLLVFQE
eukprot:TRINITY_DN8461_c0_g1_i1.p1 TRINITY_DN8461_c0_g1~~TRINITY_DN8461_c0_g1_i1.p1  ORF type:complete len:205 (+),score=76.21 TRINITY_DN8461_c0_g1_i1:58-615(+)